MHRKPTIPTPRMRLRNDDESVPALHLTIVRDALAQIDHAARQIGGVLHTYGQSDPRARDLRNIITRVDMVLFVGDGWLAWHPVNPAQPERREQIEKGAPE